MDQQVSPRPSSRRVFLRWLGLTGVSALGLQAIACSPASSPVPAAGSTPASAQSTVRPATAPTAVATAAPASASKGSATLTWLTHPVFETVTADLLARYQQEAGVQVVLDKMPSPGIRDKAYLELSSGSDRYDMVAIVSDTWTYDINPTLEPLDDWMKRLPPPQASDLNEGLLKLFQDGSGEQFGFPLRSGVFIVHYRKDLYDQLGLRPARTWDEYKEHARKLNEPPNRYGEFIMGTQDIFSAHQYMSMLFSFGGKVLSDDLKTCLVNNEAGVATLEYWASFVKDGLTPPGAPSAKWDDQITAMQQGLAAQTIAWSPYAVNINDPSKSKFNGKYGWAVAPVAPQAGLPHSSTFMNCWGIFIPKTSKNKEAAWKFLIWLTGPDNDVAMALKGNGPVRNATYTNPEYQKVNPSAEVTVEAARYGNTGVPPVPKRPEITTILATELNAAAAGAKTPRQAADAIVAQVNPLL